MKARVLLLLLLPLALMTGCKKEEIVKALPIMYFGSGDGKASIIMTQNDLDIFLENNLPKSTPPELIKIPSELTNIDFDKYTLAIGSHWYRSGIDTLEHLFYKRGGKLYEYHLTIVHDLTSPVGSFTFGILVNKLPPAARVELIVKRVNE